MNKNEFKNFFKPYAQNVDKANKLKFWELSDKLVTQIIKNNVSSELSEDTTILDAGGGTGRWACDLASIYKSDFLVYDLSEDMLSKATENIKKRKLENRVKTIHGDLSDMSEIKSNSVDVIVSIYSPLSFVYNPEEASKELCRILKPGGVMIIMAHSYYNAIDSKINNYLAEAGELDELNKTRKVKWAPHVPDLYTYSAEDMKKLFENTGLEEVAAHGVPVFVRPGPEDWDPENEKISRISESLQSEKFFNKVFELEMEHNSKPGVVNRGMNIFSVFKKNN